MGGGCCGSNGHHDCCETFGWLNTTDFDIGASNGPRLASRNGQQRESEQQTKNNPFSDKYFHHFDLQSVHSRLEINFRIHNIAQHRIGTPFLAKTTTMAQGSPHSRSTEG